MWMWSLSQKIILYYTYLFFFLWWYEMIKCLHDKWGERGLVTVLGFCWPFDAKSEGESSASRPQLAMGSWNFGKLNHKQGKC